MKYFIVVLIIGVVMLALLLLVFFLVGKKNRKQRNADLKLVQECGDESLIHLYEQAASDNERDGIVEFIKEKVMGAPTTPELPPEIMPQIMADKELAPVQASAPERRILPGLYFMPEQENKAEGSNHIESTHTMAVEKIDWEAIQDELKKRREEEARIMAQNQHIQEVFFRIKDVEERLMVEPKNND